VQAFVLALYAMVREAGDESVERMLGPGLKAALHTLP
jgi:hypothetical protein